MHKVYMINNRHDVNKSFFFKHAEESFQEVEKRLDMQKTS